LRVASINLRGFPSHGRIAGLAVLIARHTPDVLLLQECRRGWLDVVAGATGMEGVHSRDVDPRLDVRPLDGCALAVRPPLKIRRAWRLSPERFDPAAVASPIDKRTPTGEERMPYSLACRYSARTILGEMELGGRVFVAASLHATRGTSRAWAGPRVIKDWTPLFHGAVAMELSAAPRPLVYAFDARDPSLATPQPGDVERPDGPSGVVTFGAGPSLLPPHRARDLLREELARTRTSPEAFEALVHTFTTSSGRQRHLDRLWATPDFTLDSLHVYKADALTAGTDQVLIVADLLPQF
jgi:hypothetical protein